MNKRQKTARPPDLTEVDPLRLAEVRRRIEVIEAYLAAGDHGPEARLEAARRVGVGPPQFMNLVRAWQAGRTPGALSSAGGRVSKPRGVRAGGLPPTTREAAEEALKRLPADASHKDAVAAVFRLCDRRRTRRPSTSMVAYLRKSIRQRIAARGGSTDIVVARAVAALPVEARDRLLLPELALAVRIGDGAVLAAGVDLGDGMPAGFGRALTRLNAGGATVTSGPDDAAAADAILAARHRSVSRFSAGRLLAKALGGGIGSVALGYNPRSSLTPASLLQADADRPLTRLDAVDVLTTALAEHNSRRELAPPRLAVRHQTAL